MSGVEVFGFCNANCRHRVLTIDQTAELIQEMAANGFQVPEGFMPSTAINKITEQNTGEQLSIFVGTQAEYDVWEGDKEHTFAIITDDPIASEILTRLFSVESSNTLLDTRVNNILNGTTRVPKSTHSTNSTNAILKSDGKYTGLSIDENGVLKCGDIIIPQKKLLWKSTSDYGELDVGTISLAEPIKAHDTIEVVLSLDFGYGVLESHKFKIQSGDSFPIGKCNGPTYSTQTPQVVIYCVDCKPTNYSNKAYNSIYFSKGYEVVWDTNAKTFTQSNSNIRVYVQAVYKVIE